MGYSEIVCQICGVSFRIGRLQTLEEVKTLDPADVGAEFVSSYVLNAIDNLWNCDNKEDDCLVHISPEKEAALKAHDKEHGINNGATSQTTNADNAMGEGDEDDEYIDTTSEMSEPYEYQSPDEGISDAVPEDNDCDMPDGFTDSRLWQQEMQHNHTKLVGTIRPYVHQSIREKQRHEQGREEEAYYMRSDFRDGYFEHIAGPNCTHEGGYRGACISLAEMRGCTVAQVLVPRPADWEAEPGDEAFEQDDDVNFFLSGLCDDVPSRDLDPPKCYPVRHDEESPYVDNCYWPDEYKDRAAMPFHPTCFEVFKRASLHRMGKVDMAGLMRWFKSEATYEDFEQRFPRSEPVYRAKDQWWRHVKGDEHLVANPCYVPAWDKALASGAMSIETASPGVFDIGAEATSLGSDRFTRLPSEIHHRILTHLVGKPVDIANLRLASRAFRQLPQRLFRDLILHHRPWLWEAWCDLPYRHWSNTSANALKQQEEKWQAREEIINHTHKVLREDDPDNKEAIAALQAQSDEIAAERAQRIVDVPAGRLAADRTDWHSIYSLLQRPTAKWPKGLQNRRRIWIDCMYILNRIELRR